MTTILQLLVVSVTVGLSVDGLVRVPPYKQYVDALEKSAKILIENVLSMEGHIPLLNDTRRHYAEIVHVVNYHGKKQSLYPYWPYIDVYYRYLNTSAPEAINNPEKVITEVKDLMNEVHYNINEIKDLINACVDTPGVCNELIHDTVKDNQDQYGVQALVLSYAGRAATEYKKRDGKFEEVSNDLRAHQYVCSSPGDLRILVAEMAHLYQILRNIPK